MKGTELSTITAQLTDIQALKAKSLSYVGDSRCVHDVIVAAQQQDIPSFQAQLKTLLDSVELDLDADNIINLPLLYPYIAQYEPQLFDHFERLLMQLTIGDEAQRALFVRFCKAAKPYLYISTQFTQALLMTAAFYFDGLALLLKRDNPHLPVDQYFELSQSAQQKCIQGWIEDSDTNVPMADVIRFLVLVTARPEESRQGMTKEERLAKNKMQADKISALLGVVTSRITYPLFFYILVSTSFSKQQNSTIEAFKRLRETCLAVWSQAHIAQLHPVSSSLTHWAISELIALHGNEASPFAQLLIKEPRNTSKSLQKEPWTWRQRLDLFGSILWRKNPLRGLFSLPLASTEHHPYQVLSSLQPKDLELIPVASRKEFCASIDECIFARYLRIHGALAKVTDDPQELAVLKEEQYLKLFDQGQSFRENVCYYYGKLLLIQQLYAVAMQNVPEDHPLYSKATELKTALDALLGALSVKIDEPDWTVAKGIEQKKTIDRFMFKHYSDLKSLLLVITHLGNTAEENQDLYMQWQHAQGFVEIDDRHQIDTVDGFDINYIKIHQYSTVAVEHDRQRPSLTQ